MTEPHVAPRTRSTRASKLLAVSVGVLLAPIVLGGAIYLSQVFASGSEMCAHCEAIRKVDQLGLVWSYSEPKPSNASHELCGDHQWVRVGCWQEAGGFAMHAATLHRK